MTWLGWFLHMPIFVLPCADTLTNAAKHLPLDRGYSPRSDRSSGGMLRIWETILQDHTLDREGRYRHLQLPLRNGALVFDNVSGRARKRSEERRVGKERRCRWAT